MCFMSILLVGPLNCIILENLGYISLTKDGEGFDDRLKKKKALEKEVKQEIEKRKTELENQDDKEM